jgi:hypothetical protein
MSRNRKQYAVPHSIKANVLDGFIGKVFGGVQAVSPEKQSEELPFEEQRHSDDHQIIQTPVDGNQKPHQTQADWIRLAIVLDRFTFVAYVCVFLGMGFLHLI